MKQPLHFLDEHFPNYVCKLKKALYSLKQAPHAWFSKLQDVLRGLGFRNSMADSSLFIRQTEKSITYMLIYVDDMLITSSSELDIDFIIKSLMDIFPTKLLGDLNYFLCIEIRRTKDEFFILKENIQLIQLKNSEWKEPSHV
jgi:hypothetical protein